MDWSKSQQASNLFEDSITKFQLKDFEGAIEDLDKAIELVQDVPEYFWNRGAFKATIGKHREAVEDFTKGIELNPKDCKAYINRGKVYCFNDKGIDHGPGARIKEAIDDFSTAIRIMPDDPEGWALRGKCKAWSGQYPIQYAIDDLDEAIALKPDFVDALRDRAMCYYKLNEFAQASEDLDKVIEKQPEEPKGHFYKAICIINSTKDYPAALEEANRALQLDPELAGAYHIRGIANTQLGHFHNAIKDYDVAIEKKTENTFDCYFQRAKVKHNLRDYEGSVADHTEAIKLKPEIPQAYFNRGIAYFYLRKFDLAMADFDKVIENGDKGALIYDWRCYTLIQVHDYERAIEEGKRALEIDPKFCVAYYRIGRAKFFLGDIAAARESQLRALEIDPNYQPAKDAIEFLDKQEAKRKTEE